MKKYLVILLILILIFPKSSLAITTSPSSHEIIGNVNGEILTYGEYIRLLNAQKKSFQKNMNYDLFSKSQEVKRKDILQEAKKAGLSISYDDFSLAWEKLLRSSGGIGKLEKKGKENRLLLVDIQRKLEDNLLLDKYFEKHIKVKLLGLMVDEAIILSEAKLRNIEVSEEEVENRLEVIRQKYGGNDGLSKFLALNNATLEDARREIRNQFLYEMVKDAISSELRTTNKEKIKDYFNMKKRTAQVTINSQGLFGKDVVDALDISKPKITSVANIENIDSSPKSAPVPGKQIIKPPDAKSNSIVNQKNNLNEITKKIADEVKKQYSAEKALLEKKLLEKELALKIEKEKAEKLKLELNKKNEIENLLVEKQIELAKLAEELLAKQSEIDRLSGELKKNELTENLLIEKQIEANRLTEELKNKEETEKLLVEKQVESDKLVEELKLKDETEKLLVEKQIEASQLAEQLKNKEETEKLLAQKEMEASRLAEELKKKEETEKLLAQKEMEASRLAEELKKKEETEKLLAQKEMEASRLAEELKKKEETEKLLAQKEMEASRLAEELKKKEASEKLLAQKEVEASRLTEELRKKEVSERLMVKKQLESDKLLLELRRKEESKSNEQLQLEKLAVEKKNYELSRAIAIKDRAEKFLKEEKEREKLGKIVRKQILAQERNELANAYVPVNNKEFKINNDFKKAPVLFSLDKKLEEKRKKALEKRIAKYASRNKKDIHLMPGIPIISGTEKTGNDKTSDFVELRNKVQENKVSEE